MLYGLTGAVADDDFGISEAKAVCRTLGLGPVNARLSYLYGTSEAPIFVNNVQCPNEAGTLFGDCTYTDLYDMESMEDADEGYMWPIGVEQIGVFCTDVYEEEVEACDPEDGQVRLVPSSVDGFYRVEIYHDGEWGEYIKPEVCTTYDCPC